MGRIPGLDVRVRPPIAGGGPAPVTVALVHGSMDRSTSFRRLERRLADATVLTYDRRGYARSADRLPSEDFADQVDDLLEVVGDRPVVAFGHSYGGGVVLAGAVRHPELIRAAVVWEPPMPWLPGWPAGTAGGTAVADGRDPADVAESFMRRMVGEEVWRRLPAATRRARRDEGAALVADMRSLRGAVPWDPAAVTIPVIVGTGRSSSPHMQRAAEDLAGMLTDAELVAEADVGHGAHLSHPSLLAELVRRVAARAGLGGVEDRYGQLGAARPVGAESGSTPTDEEAP